MTAETKALPQVGDVVEVRARRHQVLALRASHGKGQTWLRLAGLEDDDAGTERELLWELEPDARVLVGQGWEALGAQGLDEVATFEAHLNALRWNAVAAADPDRFLSPHRAGIEVKAYQLAPLRQALRQPRVALLVADDVGLGKTIEAGLIARELLLRGRLRHLVVAAPASVVHQWQGELLERFGLDATVMDRAYVDAVRRRFGFAANPWGTASHFVISHALLRDEAYAEPLRAWLGTAKPGTMLVLDEAHHAAPASGFAYATDSQLTRAVRELATRFEHRLFLSATPHNGHSNSFTSLLEMLDPTRFVRGVKVERAQLAPVMVRRLKRELAPWVPGFTTRQVEAFPIAGLPEDAPDLALHRALARYLQLRQARLAQAPKGAQRAARLASVGLVKRLLSGFAAFARTLRLHAEGARSALSEAPEVLALPGLGLRAMGADEATEAMDALPEAQGEDAEAMALDQAAMAEALEASWEADEAWALRRAGQASGRPHGAELQALEALEALARGLADRPCAKTWHLAEWVQRELAPGGRWGARRVLVFTEYTDTMRALKRQLSHLLEEAGLEAEDAVAVLHGATDEQRRRELVRRFNAPADQEPLRVLIATDAAREGLNLQAACADLIHFDLPWNPARLEQRNGRLDRLLQPSPEVRVRYYVYTQRPEDRVLEALVRKTEAIQAELGSMGEVLERALEEELALGASQDQAEALVAELAHFGDPEGQAEAQEDLGQADAEGLQAELESLRGLLDRSRQAQAMDEGRFLRAINVALALHGAPALAPEGRAYRVPALDGLLGASWQRTMDALRPPRPQSQKLWQWRQATAIRPVVFEDTGRLGGEVAHLHLEHRLAKRLLAGFTAGQSRERGLKQAVALRVASGAPRVLLLGRLVLHGLKGERLHDELLAVEAPWAPAGLARSAPTPVVGEAWEALWAALGQGQAAPEGPARLATREADLAALKPAWLAWCARAEAQARAALAARGEAEAEALAAQLDALREALKRQIREGERPKRLESWERRHKAQEAKGQLAFAVVLDARRGMSEAEREKRLREEAKAFERDRQHWEKRLERLGAERAEEPERLRRAYAVGLARVEAVGLVHLCPVGG